ncbi:MAG: hypothetical protein A2Y25_10150 [Candidatus Melainabacteria bacterium GWF2_37_15]|nr:MAG: hypothetical protein A2Y25_10150 [Candidatus Melainabacteria bacterium GWF2_37_15]
MSEHIQNEGYCKCGEHYQCACKHEHSHKDKCSYRDELLELADEAWMEVLKDKIKANILAKKGDEVQKLADIISKANGERWENKMKAKRNMEDYKNTLKDYYSSK